MVGNRGVAHVAERSRPTLGRYQVEGPWNKNDPVHEVLTQTAILTNGVPPGVPLVTYPGQAIVQV